MDKAKAQLEAHAILERIPTARSGLRQRLLLAAALTKLLVKKPTVVGGTAEEHWVGKEYHATDLDLCPTLSEPDVEALKAIGMRKKGRHWVREDLPVAVEFPGSGDDIERTVVVEVNRVAVRMISCEDLYLDRLRQATVGWPSEDISFDSAMAIALTNYRSLDWDYVRERLRAASTRERKAGALMIAVNRRVRARARRGNLLPG